MHHQKVKQYIKHIQLFHREKHGFKYECQTLKNSALRFYPTTGSYLQRHFSKNKFLTKLLTKVTDARWILRII